MSFNNRKLKICHVITRMTLGEAQENTLRSIIGLIEKGHEVVLITGSSSKNVFTLESNIEIPKFEIIELPELVREINGRKDLAAYNHLKKIFKERQFDVVHTHRSKAGIVGRAAAWRNKVPLVVHTIHRQSFHPSVKPIPNALFIKAERWAAKRCHRIYSVGKTMIDECVKAKIAKPEKYKIIYSGIDIQPFYNAEFDLKLKLQLGIPMEAKVVGVVSKLSPRKGYEYFLPVAHSISGVYPNAHFLVVGDGPMREWMEKKVNSMRLAKKFHFTGHIPQDQVYRYISIMDIMMHLSLRAGVPRSIVQALAAGVPAIGFNLDGIPELIIDGETGYCAPPKDTKTATANALHIFSYPDLARKMAENGKKLVEGKFDWHGMVDCLEQEYFEHLSNN